MQEQEMGESVSRRAAVILLLAVPCTSLSKCKQTSSRLGGCFSREGHTASTKRHVTVQDEDAAAGSCHFREPFFRINMQFVPHKTWVGVLLYTGRYSYWSIADTVPALGLVQWQLTDC